MADVNTKPQHKGGGITYCVGALCTLGGLLGISVWLAKGTWPAPLEHDVPAAVGCSATVGMLLFGVAAVCLATAMRRGSFLAALILAALSWTVFLGTVVHLYFFGRGWYEMGLLGLMIIDVHVTLLWLAREDDTRDNPGRSSSGEPKDA